MTRSNLKWTSTTSGRGQNAQEKRQKTSSLTTEDIPAIVKAVVDALPASRQDGGVAEDGSTKKGQQTTDGDSGEQRDSREQSQHEEFGECLSVAIYYVRTC